jgi:hypothetical protein
MSPPLDRPNRHQRKFLVPHHGIGALFDLLVERVKSGHCNRCAQCPLPPPKADMCGALGHVCFGPKADIEGNYSITSSAATSSPAGIFKPIAAAALILTDVSNLVGLHGKVGRFVAAANAIHIRGRQAELKPLDLTRQCRDCSSTENHATWCGLSCLLYPRKRTCAVH